MKKISILTCVFGQPENLINTMNSLKHILSDNLTWTIKFHDNSSENFINIFRNQFIYTHKIADQGLYDAMNQALNLMDSDYYFVIGSGDELNPEPVLHMMELLKNDSYESSIYFFPVEYLGSGLVLDPEPDKFSVKMASPHPGTILSRLRSMELGGYDTRYKIASDYDHLSRYVLKFGAGKIGKEILVKILAGGISEKNNLEAYLEEELIRKRVWNSVDWLTYQRMLNKSAENISFFVNQILKNKD